MALPLLPPPTRSHQASPWRRNRGCGRDSVMARFTATETRSLWSIDELNDIASWAGDMHSPRHVGRDREANVERRGGQPVRPAPRAGPDLRDAGAATPMSSGAAAAAPIR